MYADFFGNRQNRAGAQATATFPKNQWFFHLRTNWHFIGNSPRNTYIYKEDLCIFLKVY